MIMITRAAIYIRVPPSMQASESNNLNAQRAKIQDYARIHSYQIVAEYYDLAKSSAQILPGLQQLEMDLSTERRKIDVVLIYKFSGFSQEIEKAGDRCKAFFKKASGLIFITKDIWATECAQHFYKATIGLMAENYSKQKGQIIRNRLQEIAKQGFYTGGRPPYGYKSVEVIIPESDRRRFKLEIHDEEINIVKLIFDFASLGLNSKWLASYLNSNEVRYRNGNLFNVRKINQILKNTCYKGEYRFNSYSENSKKIVIIVPVPKAVSTENFDLIQRDLNENDKTVN